MRDFLDSEFVALLIAGMAVSVGVLIVAWFVYLLADDIGHYAHAVYARFLEGWN